MHQPLRKPIARESFHKRRWVRRTGALFLVLLMAFGVYRAVRPSPLSKVKQLREQFAAQAKNWTSEQRQEKGREMRQAMANLSESQREALAAEGRQRFEDQLRQYHQMSPTEKARHLDEQIKRSERMRQQSAQRPQTPGGNANGAGPRQGQQNRSAEEREKRRKERLNNTTPEFRALMDQYRKDMAARRQQLGLPASGGGGRPRA